MKKELLPAYLARSVSYVHRVARESRRKQRLLIVGGTLIMQFLNKHYFEGKSWLETLFPTEGGERIFLLEERIRRSYEECAGDFRGIVPLIFCEQHGRIIRPYKQGEFSHVDQTPCDCRGKGVWRRDGKLFRIRDGKLTQTGTCSSLEAMAERINESEDELGLWVRNLKVLIKNARGKVVGDLRTLSFVANHEGFLIPVFPGEQGFHDIEYISTYTDVYDELGRAVYCRHDGHAGRAYDRHDLRGESLARIKSFVEAERKKKLTRRVKRTDFSTTRQVVRSMALPADPDPLPLVDTADEAILREEEPTAQSVLPKAEQDELSTLSQKPKQTAPLSAHQQSDDGETTRYIAKLEKGISAITDNLDPQVLAEAEAFLQTNRKQPQNTQE